MTEAPTSTADNIDPQAVNEKAKAAATRKRRLEANRRRSAEWRLEQSRKLPPDLDTVCTTMVLCLLDVVTLPPSKRSARGEVIQDVLRQAFRTLETMGHPDVGRSMVATRETLLERLRTERFHHPLVHMAAKTTPLGTPVTTTVRGPYAHLANRQFDRDTDRVSDD